MTAPDLKPDLKLHAIPDWASVIIRFALEEMAVPHTLVKKDFDAGDLDSPVYRAINPLGLIPAMETPNGPMFETAAILLWLTDRHGSLAPGPHDADRAAFLSWLFFTSNALHPAAMALIYPDRPAGEAAAAAAIAVAHDQVRARLGLVEAMIAAKHPRWLSATEPGVLGYYIGTLVRWMTMLPPAPHAITLTAFPALHAVLAAHEARPAALRVALADGLGPTPFTNPVS